MKIYFVKVVTVFTKIDENISFLDEKYISNG